MSIKKNLRMISGGKAVVESLKIEGVKYVFGLIGSATMEIFDSLYNNQKFKRTDCGFKGLEKHVFPLNKAPK